jgi:hypothetical protein
LGVEKYGYLGKSPEMGTPIYGRGLMSLPRYGLSPKGPILVDKPVDGLPRISPQGDLAPLTVKAPTSGVESPDSIQIYGLHEDIHTIHSPYYYYDSYILFNK